MDIKKTRGKWRRDHRGIFDQKNCENSCTSSAQWSERSERRLWMSQAEERVYSGPRTKPHVITNLMPELYHLKQRRALLILFDEFLHPANTHGENFQRERKTNLIKQICVLCIRSSNVHHICTAEGERVHSNIPPPPPPPHPPTILSALPRLLCPSVSLMSRTVRRGSWPFVVWQRRSRGDVRESDRWESSEGRWRQWRSGCKDQGGRGWGIGKIDHRVKGKKKKRKKKEPLKKKKEKSPLLLRKSLQVTSHDQETLERRGEFKTGGSRSPSWPHVQYHVSQSHRHRDTKTGQTKSNVPLRKSYKTFYIQTLVLICEAGTTFVPLEAFELQNK